MQPVAPPPPNPVLLNPTKVVGRRILAWFIDAVIGTIIVFGYAAATFTNTDMGSTVLAELQCELVRDVSNDTCINVNETVYVGSSGDTGVIVLLWFVWVLLATIVLPSVTGWSPGKLVAGLRVVKDDTFEKAGFGANLVRALVWMLDAFPYFLPGLGGILMLATDKNQRLGDLAASTVVIRAEAVGNPPAQVAAPTSAPPPGVFGAPPGLPTTGAAPVATPAATAPPPPPGTSAGPPPPMPTPSAAPPSAFGAPPAPTTSAPPPPVGQPFGVQPPPPPGAAPGATPPPPVFPPPPTPAAPAPPAPEPALEPTEVFPAVAVPGDDDEATTIHDPVADTEPTTVHDTVADTEPNREAAPWTIGPTPTPTPAVATEPAPPTQPPTSPPQRPGVDSPTWDDARDTYIQWDPELNEWMEWSEGLGRWVPISR